jgi:RNA polymerase sigma-70 factor (ECF subfamily)
MNDHITGNEDADAELVHRCQKNDVDAFEEIVRMFNISFRMTGDYHETAEVVQDAFVSAYRNIRNFKGRSKFSTWLYSIVINLSKNRLNQMRTKAFREQFSLDDPVETEDGYVRSEPVSGGLSVLERLEKAEIARKVQGCIGTLENDFREVIVLRDIQGFSYDEISDILKIARGTVKSRIHRAREFVKNCLKKFIGDM